MPDIQIYVDNRGDDSHDGSQAFPLRTADEAFRRLPPSWDGAAEIIFISRKGGSVYPISTAAVAFGTPIGPDASPLVIRGGYLTVAESEDAVVEPMGNHVDINSPDWAADPDGLMGAVLTRETLPPSLYELTGIVTSTPTVSSIRGNANARIYLQRPILSEPSATTIRVQRPAVTLQPLVTLNLTSHDGRSPNLTLIGIKIAPAAGAGLNLLNVRAQCDTCEFFLPRSTGHIGPSTSQILVHTDSRIMGGIEIPDLSPGLPRREQAGVFIHSDDHRNIVWAVRGGIIAGHLTFDKITVRVSQGGVFVPSSLEARAAPIQILSGGSAIAQPTWGTERNKARIRNVPVDAGRLPSSPGGVGLRVYNGSIVSPLAPINLDIYGCQGDGIRLDMCSIASFGPPGGNSGLVTSGEHNRGFGMNVRNASRALVGGDAATQPLTGGAGDVTLDGQSPAHQWREITGATPTPTPTPLSNAGMSLVRMNS